MVTKIIKIPTYTIAYEYKDGNRTRHDIVRISALNQDQAIETFNNNIVGTIENIEADLK